MGQQLLNATGLVRRQPRENVLQIRIGIVPIHARRLHQAHHGRRTLARAQASGEEPVVPPNGNRSDLVLDPVVVHGQLPVICEARQRSPAAQAVVQRPGSRRAVRQFLPLQCHPLVQRIEYRFGVLLAKPQALLGV